MILLGDHLWTVETYRPWFTLFRKRARLYCEHCGDVIEEPTHPLITVGIARWAFRIALVALLFEFFTRWG